MSKGRPVVCFRFDLALLEEMKRALIERNMNNPMELWTLAQWVRVACLEKLDKIKRGRGKRGGVLHPRDYGHEQQ